jgi:hypothetical protein
VVWSPYASSHPAIVQMKENLAREEIRN